MQCRSHVAQLGSRYADFKEHNFEVLVILGDSIDKARRYVESLHLPFPVLADPQRDVYQQYGLNKTFFLQRTASVVIDCNGIIQYIKATANPMPWLQEYHKVLEILNSMAVAC